jgi:hypothetical protein
MTDLDPSVQDAVQRHFGKLTDLEPPDASFDCSDCAESVDGKPGNSACQQCREDENVAR